MLSGVQTPGSVTPGSSGEAAAPSQILSVALVCDVRLYCDAIAAAIGDSGDLKLVDVFGTAESSGLVIAAKPNVVLMDLSNPAHLSDARALAQALSPIPLVGFGVGCVTQALACAEAGLAAFVGADGCVRSLLQAARAAVSGQLLCSPEVAAGMARALARRATATTLRSAAQPSQAGLTPRETEVAALVREGFSNKEIAQMLAISPATVKNHVHIILEKLQIGRRVRLARTHLPSALGQELSRLASPSPEGHLDVGAGMSRAPVCRELPDVPYPVRPPPNQAPSPCST